MQAVVAPGGAVFTHERAEESLAEWPVGTAEKVLEALKVPKVLNGPHFQHLSSAPLTHSPYVSIN